MCECFCLFVELTHLKAKVYDMFYFFAAVLGDVCYLTETSCGRFPEKPDRKKRYSQWVIYVESWENTDNVP